MHAQVCPLLYATADASCALIVAIQKHFVTGLANASQARQNESHEPVRIELKLRNMNSWVATRPLNLALHNRTYSYQLLPTFYYICPFRSLAFRPIGLNLYLNVWYKTRANSLIHSDTFELVFTLSMFDFHKTRLSKLEIKIWMWIRTPMADSLFMSRAKFYRSLL